MTTNMQQLVITLDPVEAGCLRRDLEKIDAKSIPYNSQLAALFHILKVYRGKT